MVLDNVEGVVFGSDEADVTFGKSPFGGESLVFTAAAVLTVSFALLSIFVFFEAAAAFRGFNLYDGTKVDLSCDV